MKTTYLDNEIILLEGYKKEGTASSYQLRKLAEYREIKQLIIASVSNRRELLKLLIALLKETDLEFIQYQDAKEMLADEILKAINCC